MYKIEEYKGENQTIHLQKENLQEKKNKEGIEKHS